MSVASSSRPARLVTVALAALAGGGCAHPTHRCAVPAPVVEATAAGGRLPLAVAARTVARTTPSETFEQGDELQRWGVDPVPPTAAMLDRLAAALFERVVADAAPGTAAAADAVLELRVEGVRFAWSPSGAGPYSAAVAYRATLRAPDGAVIASFDLGGEGARGAAGPVASRCEGIGDSVALAVQDAGAKLVARLGTDPAVAAWLGARGIPAPTLSVRRAPTSR